MRWFYYSPNGKQGPFSVEELKRLAAIGILKKNMVVENQKGDQALADTVNGLVFSESQSMADRRWSIPQAPPIFERNEPLTLDDEDASANADANAKPDSNPDATQDSPQDANALSGKGNFLKKLFQRQGIRRWSVFFHGLKLMFVVSKNDVKIDELAVRKSVNFLKIFFSIFLIFYCLTVVGLFFGFLASVFTSQGLGIAGLITSGVVALFLVFSGVGGYFFLRGIFCLLIELGIKLPFQTLKQMKEIERILKGIEDASSCSSYSSCVAPGRDSYSVAEFQKNGSTNPTNPPNQSASEIPYPPKYDAPIR